MKDHIQGDQVTCPNRHFVSSSQGKTIIIQFDFSAAGRPALPWPQILFQRSLKAYKFQHLRILTCMVNFSGGIG